MPRRKSPPRLYLDKARGGWVIRDGAAFIRTGCLREQLAEAESKLAEYIGEKYSPEPSDSPLITEVLNAYMVDVVAHRVTKKEIGYNLGSLNKWWAGKRASDVKAQTCRAYAATKTPAAAWADLKYLRAALNHWDQEYKRFKEKPSIWTPDPGGNRERWLTRTEAAKLLWAARRTQHLRRLILLGLRTGSRPGVLLKLTWDQIDLKHGLLIRDPTGRSRRTKKKAPPVKLGWRILSHLRRWRRLWPKEVYVCHYEGRQITELDKSWARAVKRAGLKGKITPHTLRHTRATWMMQRGINPWEAAGSLGMTLKTLEATYGHHHPDFQSNAADV